MRVLLVTAAFAAALLPEAWAQQKIERRIPIAPDASIRIHNMAGSVRVSGWDKDSIAVSGTLAPGSGQFFLGGAGRAAKLGVDPPMGKGATAPAHLEVSVPRRSRVWIKTASADVHATDLAGGVDAYSVSGGVRVHGRAGEVYAESMDGNVEVTADARWVRAKTATGSVTLRIAGGDASASTVSGNIVVSGSRFDRARFESVTGDIRFEGDFDRGGAFTFESHGGTVELVVPAAVQAHFEVSTIHGRIANHLSRTQVRTSRDGAGKELSFEAGAGGADVTVRSFKGDVLLRRK